jgi:tRNA 2-thiouridine synthesizing protein E
MPACLVYAFPTDSTYPETVCLEELDMAVTMDDILHPGLSKNLDPDFPHAPPGWTRARGKAQAKEENLEMGDDHWALVKALQDFYARHEADSIQLRELRDALDEHFHHKGGNRYLYTLFPGGPIAQGSRIAGLQAPFGAEDKNFGSVA